MSPRDELDASDLVDDTARELSVGLLGTSFMGRAHSHALLLARTVEDSPRAVPRLTLICGRDQQRAAAMQRRFGWQRTTADWRILTGDAEIAAFMNAAPNNLHAQPTIAAAASGKHVICEKPLGRNAAEALAMRDAAVAAGVVHMCAFNYRFFPAIRLARSVIEAGELGDILHFRSRFLLPSAATGGETPWRLTRDTAGSGVIGDLLAHHIDVARYLIGEPTAVSATARTWSPTRAGVTVDVEDAVAATIEFESGAIGTMEATRATPGHILESVIEVDGSRGSLQFDMRNVNGLRHSAPSGSTLVDTTTSGQPFSELWWPAGHGLGWAESFVHEIRHFLGACVGAWTVAPHGATFDDGYRCAVVCDAVVEAVANGQRVPIRSGSDDND